MPQIYEYRGVEGLVYAEVLQDGVNYTTGTVKDLAGVAEISKATDSTNEAHYYDNMPAVIVSSTGADTLTISASAIPLDVLADITGQTWDSTKGAFVERTRTPKYFALGYKTKDTSGREYFCWRLKGSFNIPEQVNSTENEGTDANGQEITFTGISTTHKFTSIGNIPCKALTVNTALQLADVSHFFDSVTTPDTLQGSTTVPQVVLNASHIEVQAGETATIEAITTPAGQTVTWSSSAETYATVADGVVTGLAEGSATITASMTYNTVTYTDTCSVTVTPAQA